VPDSSSGDGELVRLAQLGDTNALGTLLARHMAGMKAVALSTVGFGPDAEDAVQEASLRVLERIGDVRNPEAVGAWLHAVVRNVCRMQLRRAARLVPSEVVGCPARYGRPLSWRRRRVHGRTAPGRAGAVRGSTKRRTAQICR